MTTIPTTMESAGVRSTGALVVPYLHPREVDSILDAIDAGDLAAIAEDGEIVALATPAMVERITARDDDGVQDVRDALARAERELRSLVTIIGEVFAEKEPSDFRYRVEDAAYDVQHELAAAVEAAEEM